MYMHVNIFIIIYDIIYFHNIYSMLCVVYIIINTFLLHAFIAFYHMHSTHSYIF